MLKRLLRQARNRRPPKPSATFDEVTEQDIYYCYRLFLKREPDQSGWSYWRNELAQGRVSLKLLTDGFLNSNEFLNKQINTIYSYVVAASGQIREVQLAGFKLFVRGNDFAVGVAIANAKTYEPHVARELRALLKHGSVFVDVGANIGYFTLLAASLIGRAGRVLAFEPNADNCELLKISIAENGFDNITLYPYAAAEQEQTFVMGVQGSNGRLISRESQAAEGQPAPGEAERVEDEIRLVVKAVVVDDILGEVERIDVIKMDIEGAEPRALQGMQRVVRTHRPVILTEFFPSLIERTSQTAPEAYLDALRTLDYDLFIIEGDAISAAPQSNQDILARQRQVDGNHVDLIAYPR